MEYERRRRPWRGEVWGCASGREGAAGRPPIWRSMRPAAWKEEGARDDWRKLRLPGPNLIVFTVAKRLTELNCYDLSQ